MEIRGPTWPCATAVLVCAEVLVVHSTEEREGHRRMNHRIFYVRVVYSHRVHSRTPHAVFQLPLAPHSLPTGRETSSAREC